MRYLLPALVVFFLFSFFSCNSEPPSNLDDAVLNKSVLGETVLPDEKESPQVSDAPSPEILALQIPVEKETEEITDDHESNEIEISIPPEAMPEISEGPYTGELQAMEEPELPEPWPFISLPPQLALLPEDAYPLDAPSEPPYEAVAVIVPPEVQPGEPAPTAETSQPVPEVSLIPDESPRPPPAAPPFIGPIEREPPPQNREPAPVSPPPDPPPSRTPPEIPREDITFSRVVYALPGQTIEIPFRGTGWVYLGELGNRRGVSYESRRLDSGSAAGSTEGQSFIFRAEATGSYILKFYKQDFIQDYIINDHVQVIVGEENRDFTSGRSTYPVDRGRVIAEPRWPPEPGHTPSTAAVAHTPSAAPQPAIAPQVTAVPAVSAAPIESPTAEVSTATASPVAEANTVTEAAPVTAAASASSVTQRPRQASDDEGITAITPPRVAAQPTQPANGQNSPAEYVRQAQQEFNLGRVEAALNILDTMRQYFPAGSDEAWWLYGQLLEANSPSRDIRLALDFYRRLIREYPQSSRATDAQNRIAYLERYYLNIR